MSVGLTRLIRPLALMTLIKNLGHHIDFLTYLFIFVKPWLLVRESKVAMQLDVSFRKSVVVRFQHHHVLRGAPCVFIHPRSIGFVLVLSF
jgi:hypothetical protein